MSIEAMKLALEALETEGLDAAIVAAEAYPKELRLFAVRCAREVKHLLKDQRSLDALDVAEKYARGKATDQELDAARDAAMAAAGDAAMVASWAAAWATAMDASWAAAWAAGDAAMAAARDAAWATAMDAAKDEELDAAWDAAKAARAAALERQKEIFLEIFNNAGKA